MRARMVIAIASLPAVCAAVLILGAPPLWAQCQDERSMADAMVKDAAEIVDTVKKESDADFVSKFHQKSCLTKLTFSINALGEVTACLDKASQSAVPADQAAAKSAKDAAAALKDRLGGYKTALKAEEDPKKAKTLIATFDLSTGAAK